MMGDGKSWVVVSGAGGAIGGAAVAHYTSQGRRVLALDRAFKSSPVAGSGTVFQTADLLVESDVDRAVSEHVPAGHRIALLINAVGEIWNEPLLSLRGGKFTTHDVDSWRRVMDANLTAPFVVAKQIAARMARGGGGCIVNFSSIARSGNAGQAAYSAAKAGIEGLTRTMATELGPLGIRVNALALGFIDVETTRRAVPEPRLQDYSDRTPLGRLGHIDEVVHAIEFLSSNAFVNGAIISVDGGLRL